MIEADPAPFPFAPGAAALLIIDMQRDFLEPGGFGALLGNDVAELRRGIDCLVLADCCASYFPEFHTAGLAMIRAQGGIFGWVAPSAAVLAALPSP